MFNKDYLFEISNQIREYMHNEKKTDIIYNEGKIIFNKTPSPDGAYGMFLLLKKNNFDLTNLTPNQKEISDLLTFSCTFKEEFFTDKSIRIQDKFENFSGSKLKKKFSPVEKVDAVHMNEYDWKVGDIKIEVKSDCWMHTGNISLELLRDHNKYNPENIGSILKTDSTFWQVFYYDKDILKGSSEIYLESQLKNKTAEYLESLKNHLGLQIDV